MLLVGLVMPLQSDAAGCHARNQQPPVAQPLVAQGMREVCRRRVGRYVGRSGSSSCLTAYLSGPEVRSSSHWRSQRQVSATG